MFAMGATSLKMTISSSSYTFVDVDALRRVVEPEEPPEGVGHGVGVHKLAVFFEKLVVALPRRPLERQDGEGVIHVVLFVLAGPELVGAGGVEGGVHAQP